MKSSFQNVSFSNITVCYDKFNDKPIEVKGYLRKFCIKKIIFFVDHTKTIHPINRKSQLHLKKLGTSILSSNFVKATPSILY